MGLAAPAAWVNEAMYAVYAWSITATFRFPLCQNQTPATASGIASTARPTVNPIAAPRAIATKPYVFWFRNGRPNSAVAAKSTSPSVEPVPLSTPVTWSALVSATVNIRSPMCVAPRREFLRGPLGRVALAGPRGPQDRTNAIVRRACCPACPRGGSLERSVTSLDIAPTPGNYRHGVEIP